jgi:C2 domain
LIVVVLKGVRALEGFLAVSLSGAHIFSRKTCQINGLSGSKYLRISRVRSRPDKPLHFLIHRQDPYCALQVGKEARRIKPLKKGGQHPEWDEEVRFPIVEDTEDILVRTSSRSGEDETPPPVPSKEPAEHKFNKKRNMQLSCYADDPREPELIGEITISLENVLTKGETDGMLVCSSVRSGTLHSFSDYRMVHPHEQGEILWRDLFRNDFLV